MRLSVREKCQTASGGSHVTIFDADLDLRPAPATVDVVLVEGAIDDFDLVSREEVDEVALRGIRSGAEQALANLGLGATIRVIRMRIHPVDFRRWAFERYTRLALTDLLAAEGLVERGA